MKTTFLNGNYAALGFGFLAACLPLQAASIFQLDFDNDGAPSPTQSGWEAFTESGDPNNKTMTFSGYTGLASGDISITTSGVEFTRNYDNTNNPAPDFPGTPLDKVYSDLILRNDLDNNLDISIGGLKAGSYQITTYHLVTVLDPDTVSTFDLLVQDADSPGFGQNVGTFSMGRTNSGLSPFSPTVIDFTVTSNGIDDITLRLDGQTLGSGTAGQANWIGINGLVIVPEPSALVVGLVAGMGLLRRRRGA